MMLNAKTAIVTGAAMGIGKAIAIDLAREGADVVVTDLNLEEAKKVADEIKAIGRKALAIKTDVTKSAEVNQMVKNVLDTFGKIDILVNNAGQGARERASLFKDSSEEVWDFVIGVNLMGVLNCCRAVCDHMIQRHSGKIINIASFDGVVGDPGMADYSGAKAGVIGFTMAFAKEVAQNGIYVNCVSPGPIETRAVKFMSTERIESLKKMTGLGRFGKPEEIAYMVSFLASEKANFITGQNFLVCGLANL